MEGWIMDGLMTRSCFSPLCSRAHGSSLLTHTFRSFALFVQKSLKAASLESWNELGSERSQHRRKRGRREGGREREGEGEGEQSSDHHMLICSIYCMLIVLS